MFKKKQTVLALSCAVVIAATSIVGTFILLNNQSSRTRLELDPNATVGIMPGIDLDARTAELQQTLDKSKIAFSVNTSPLFDQKTREGNILLENPQSNAKLLVATLVLDSNQEVLYTSKALAPGSYLEKVKLDKSLKSGVHNATVYLVAYDIETQDIIGQTGAAVTLTVV